jgi:hypothetical protein
MSCCFSSSDSASTLRTPRTPRQALSERCHQANEENRELARSGQRDLILNNPRVMTLKPPEPVRCSRLRPVFPECALRCKGVTDNRFAHHHFRIALDESVHGFHWKINSTTQAPQLLDHASSSWPTTPFAELPRGECLPETVFSVMRAERRAEVIEPAVRLCEDSSG